MANKKPSARRVIALRWFYTANAAMKPANIPPSRHIKPGELLKLCEKENADEHYQWANQHWSHLKILPGSYIVSRNSLDAFRAANPKFSKLVAPLIEANRMAAIPAAKGRVLAAPAIMRGDGHYAFEAITHATRTLPVAIRGEIQGDMFLALAEGRLKIRDIPARVREFVTIHNRSDRQSVFNPWGHLSLEKPLGEDGSLKLMDVIREDQRLWTCDRWTRTKRKTPDGDRGSRYLESYVEIRSDSSRHL